MLQNLIDCWTLRGIIVEDLGDDVTGSISDGDLVWEVVGVHTNALVGGLDVRCLEGGLANNERVDYDSNRPNVDLIRVALLTLKDFRCDVIWRAANCAFALAVELKLSSKTKVTNFHLHLVVEEKVAKL